MTFSGVQQRGNAFCAKTHCNPAKEYFIQRAKHAILPFMIMNPSDLPSGVTRREALKQTSKALAGVAGMAALSQLTAGISNGAEVSTPASASPPDQPKIPVEKLRIATCQFPVGGNPVENAKYIRDFMHQAVADGAHLLHTSEACLSGYAGIDMPSFEKYDWEALRHETASLRKLARDLKLWLVLGSAHFLDAQSKPTNCVYPTLPSPSNCPSMSLAC